MSDVITCTDGNEYPPIEGLTELQCRFVYEYLANPKSKSKAAVRAGYSSRSAHVSASRLLLHPLVAQALLDGTRVRLASAAPEALGVQLQLMRSAKSELVREKAASGVLDRVITPDRAGGGGTVHIHIDLGD